MSFGQDTDPFEGFSAEQVESSTQQTQGNQPAATVSRVLKDFSRAVQRGEVDSATLAVQLQSLVNELGQGGTSAGAQQTPQPELTHLSSKVNVLEHELSTLRQSVAHVQTQQQQPAPPTSLLPKIKIDLPSKFDGSVAKLRGWLFEVEQYQQIKSLDSAQIVALAVTLFVSKAKIWWETRAQTGSSWRLGQLRWSRLKAELEVVFGDPDRDRKLITRFQQFVQKNDVASYIANFRTLRLELGQLISDESALWGFVAGLKMDLKREVLRHPNLTTVEDAILAAERAEAVDKFARFGMKNIVKAPPKNNGIVPMEIDAMQQQRQQPSTSRGPRQQFRS